MNKQNEHSKNGKSAEKGNFSKSWIFILVILSLVFMAGCLSGPKTADTASTVSPAAAANQIPNLIVQPSDVPGFNLKESSLYAYTASKAFTFNERNFKGIYYECNPNGCNRKTLTIGDKEVGQGSNWKAEDGRYLTFMLFKFDDISAAINAFESETKACKVRMDTGMSSAIEYSCRPAGIGDYSIFEYIVQKDQPDIGRVGFQFLKGKNFVYFQYMDDKKYTMTRATEIAKNVAGRLN